MGEQILNLRSMFTTQATPANPPFTFASYVWIANLDLLNVELKCHFFSRIYEELVYICSPFKLFYRSFFYQKYVEGRTATVDSVKQDQKSYSVG